ncbi:MAG: MFS transporter [Candidatus Methylomirabilales bacterium]
MPGRPFPLLPLLFLAGVFYLNFVGRVVLAPLLPVIARDLGLGHAAAGSLFLFQSLGHAAGLMVSGFTSWRLGHRQTIVLSTLALGAALLALAASTSPAAMGAVMPILGAAAGLYLPAAIATLIGLTDEAQWGRATAIHELAPGLGFVTAPLLAEALLRSLSWRGILAVFGVALLAVGGLYARWGRGGHRRGERPRLKTMLALGLHPGLPQIAVLFTLAVGAGFGVYMMLPLFLVAERGMDRPSANALLGLSRALSLPMIFGAGWLADRLGQRRALVAFQGATGLLTAGIALLAGPAPAAVAVVLHATASVCFFPACYPLIATTVPPAQRNLAVSLVSLSGTLLGAGLTPALIGAVAEAWSFAPALLLLGLLTLASPLLLLLDRPAPRTEVG